MKPNRRLKVKPLPGKAATLNLAINVFFLVSLTAHWIAFSSAVWIILVVVLSSTLLIFYLEKRENAQTNYFNCLLDNLPSAIVIFDKSGTLVAVNDRYSALYNLDPSEVRLGMTQQELVALRRRHGLPVIGHSEAIIRRLLGTDRNYFVERWKLPNGKIIEMTRLMLKEGGFIAKHNDITPEVSAAAQLEETQRLLDAVIEHIPSGIVVKDAMNLRYVLLNRAAENILGVDRAFAKGKSSYDIYNLDQAEAITTYDRQALAEVRGCSNVHDFHFINYTRDQKIISTTQIAIRMSEKEPTYLLTVVNDVTQLKQKESDIQYLALHDTLTGLFNRTWLNEHLRDLNHTFADNPPWIIFIDLDNFKEINDSFGHMVGDHVLITTAKRIQVWLNQASRAVRLGGDEFAIIMYSYSAGDAMIIAEQLLDNLTQPIEFESQTLVVSASAGLSRGTDAASIDDLMIQADIALYEAKRLGKNCVQAFTPAMLSDRLKRKHMEMELWEALSKHQLSLQYQPIFELQSLRTVSVEALLRWNHPIFGQVPPSVFIPIAEESGAIIALGLWTLRIACEAAKSIPEDVRISVNLSPTQIKDLKLVDHVVEILRDTGIKPSRLEIEITEETPLDDNSHNLGVLNAFRTMGVHIVMDDFGAGYSSLNYLRRFKFDKLKIDKTYMDLLQQDMDAAQKLLRGFLALARELGMSTTAEGVEEHSQLVFLRSEGCQQAQGYLFSKPLDFAALLDYLHNQDINDHGTRLVS